jgi:hypothetical protein
MIYGFSCTGTPADGLRNHGRLRTMEVPMATHSDHHITDTEDASFDATVKIAGTVIALFVIAAVAFWYFF